MMLSYEHLIVLFSSNLLGENFFEVRERCAVNLDLIAD